MNDEVPGEGDFDAGRRHGEFDDITLESAFLVFPESKQPPKLVEYFGKALPYAMTGLLVVYALRNTPILTGSHGIPELIACAVITLLHLWKRNMLLSTAGGTAVYMLLIQLVF